VNPGVTPISASGTVSQMIATAFFTELNISTVMTNITRTREVA
jgi:hypothetical protein